MVNAFSPVTLRVKQEMQIQLYTDIRNGYTSSEVHQATEISGSHFNVLLQFMALQNYFIDLSQAYPIGRRRKQIAGGKTSYQNCKLKN